MALSSHRELDYKEFEKRFDTVMTTGYSLGSYVDEQFAKTTARSALQQAAIFDPKRTFEETSEEQEALKQTSLQWHQEYRALLQRLEKDRKGC